MHTAHLLAYLKLGNNKLNFNVTVLKDGIKSVIKELEPQNLNYPIPRVIISLILLPLCLNHQVLE